MFPKRFLVIGESSYIVKKNPGRRIPVSETRNAPSHPENERYIW